MMRIMPLEEALEGTTKEERLEAFYSILYPNSKSGDKDGYVNSNDISLQEDRFDYSKQFEGKHYTSFGELITPEEYFSKEKDKTMIRK